MVDDEVRIIAAAEHDYRLRMMNTPLYKILGILSPMTESQARQLRHFAKQGVKVRLK